MTPLPARDDTDPVHANVRAAYEAVAVRGASCCGGAGPDAERVARAIGYGEEELRAVPDGANLGVGCGNPGALAALRLGETVLDLGCGAGFDVFLAARAVGPGGRAIGVDMTEAMLERARANARQGAYANVEFRLGTIEDLPVEDASVDAVISNCVINLSPDKPRVFREAFRVLRPGGRLTVSDLVLTRPLPAPLRASVEAWVGCLAGAVLRDEYLGAIEAAGFRDVAVVSEASYAGVVDVQTPELREVGERAGLSADEIEAALASVASVKISAQRPSEAGATATSRVLGRDEARRFYDRFGARQDSQAFYEGPAIAELVSHLQLERARAVVEFGCGTGRLAASLLRERLGPQATYLALDQSRTMVELARGRLAAFGSRAEVRQTDGSPRVAAPDAAFDRFLSTYVLDLLSPEDIAAALREAHRVLEPGGLLGLVGLTFGSHGAARAVTWILEHVHRLRPALVGGCRPLEITRALSAGDWKIRHHGVVAPYAIASEIVVAERL